MPIDIHRFAKVRPYLYHLTARGNVPYIQQDMVLKSSSTLYAEAGKDDLSRQVRRGPRQLNIGQRIVQLRDQDPLHVGKITFHDGWTLETLVSHLDDHVFFWPGSEIGPVLSGRNHFARYVSERPIVLRVATEQLV